MRRIPIQLFVYFCAAFLIVSLILVIFPNPLIRLYLNYIEKDLGIEISFLPGRSFLFEKWHIKDVNLSSETGYRLDIEDIILRPSLRSLRRGELSFSCSAKNVEFYKELPLLDSVCEILSIRPFKNVAFETVDAGILLGKNRISLDGLKAESENIKIFGEGTADTESEALDFSLKFLFSEDISSRVHDAVKLSLLKREDAGWMSLSLNVSGDYRRPHLKLKTDFLQLNIKGISIK